MTTPSPNAAAPDPVKVAQLLQRLDEAATRSFLAIGHLREDCRDAAALIRAMQEVMSAQGGGEAVAAWFVVDYVGAHPEVFTSRESAEKFAEDDGGTVHPVYKSRPAPEVKDATGEEWRNDEPPKSGVPFHGMDVYSMRWTPYSKKSEQYKRGLRGRWQRAKEHGGWENCELPSAWRPDSQYFSGGRADD